MPVDHVRLSSLKPVPAGTPVFADLNFSTPWEGLDYVALTPGDEDCPDARSEVGLVLLSGRLDCRTEFAALELASPSVLLIPPGSQVRAVPADGEARFLSVRVRGGQSDGGMAKANVVAPEKLTWRPAIHGGAGQIATRHIWGPDDFASPWTFLDHAILAPESSVGYHYHDALEECFVILEGGGHMTIADRTFDVGPGSVTWQGIQQGHGIFNSGESNLEFLRVAVASLTETSTTIDLHDDLANRLPP